MKYAGWISTVLALSIVSLYQSLIPDDFTRMLAWAAPSGVALLGWIIQVATYLKKFKDLLVEAVVARVKKELSEMEPRIASRCVDEVWNRLDTIKMFTKNPAPEKS